MKLNRFLWILMVALLVPAMALSSCDKKKTVNSDKDDDSSSGSKEKSEQVDKDTDTDKEKEIDSDDLIGKYKGDPGLIKEAIGDDIPEGFDNAEVSLRLELKKNKKHKFSMDFSLSGYYVEPFQTTVNIGFTAEANGDWKYDKQKRSLTLYKDKTELLDPEITFDEMTPELQEAISEFGSLEALKSYLISEMDLDPDEFFDTDKAEYINIEMTDDGFKCVNKKENKKLKFNRID